MKSQRKNRVAIAVVFLLALSAFFNGSAFGWGKKTHNKLTEQVIQSSETSWFEPYLQNNFGFKDHVNEKLPYKRLGVFTRTEQMSVLEILKDGAEREDEWPYVPYPYTSRPRNHFHSPLKAIDEAGQSGFPGGESALGWMRRTGEGCTLV